ncbi:MAG: WxcM-like domain-containing protein [Flavobacteriales bacterium]|nr:WxcM-like domain-containing protein [Flavobacteriales bacterium]
MKVLSYAKNQTGCVGLVDLPVISDPRGDLTFLEGDRHVPFPIRRVYFLYNVPVDSERGGHAHRELEQVVFALSGSFRIKVDDGTSKTEYWLRNPRKGLYINRMVWREMDSFSQGAVCMVIASQYYDEGDYFRNYEDFQKEVTGKFEN